MDPIGAIYKAVLARARERNEPFAMVMVEYGGIVFYWIVFGSFILAMITGMDPITFLQARGFSIFTKIAAIAGLYTVGLMIALAYEVGASQLASIYLSVLSDRNEITVSPRMIIPILFLLLTIVIVPYAFIVVAIGVRVGIGITADILQPQIMKMAGLGLALSFIFVYLPGMLRQPYTLEELKKYTAYRMVEGLTPALKQIQQENPVAYARIVSSLVFPEHAEIIPKDVLMSLTAAEALNMKDKADRGLAKYDPDTDKIVVLKKQ